MFCYFIFLKEREEFRVREGKNEGSYQRGEKKREEEEEEERKI